MYTCPYLTGPQQLFCAYRNYRYQLAMRQRRRKDAAEPPGQAGHGEDPPARRGHDRRGPPPRGRGRRGRGRVMFLGDGTGRVPKDKTGQDPALLQAELAYSSGSDSDFPSPPSGKE